MVCFHMLCSLLNVLAHHLWMQFSKSTLFHRFGGRRARMTGWIGKAVLILWFLNITVNLIVRNYNFSTTFPIQSAILARQPPKRWNMYSKYHSKIRAMKNNTWTPPNARTGRPAGIFLARLFWQSQQELFLEVILLEITASCALNKLVSL